MRVKISFALAVVLAAAELQQIVSNRTRFALWAEPQ